MNYRLIYKVPFATLDNVPCVVEIEKENYLGTAQELTPGESPFTVEIDDEEFLYTPTRFSTATIRVVGGDYLQSLFSTAYQQYRVTFIKDGVISWCGFISPELYTQDYSSAIFELELKCMSAMSTLEFIDYKQLGGSREFVSIWELIKRCIKSASSQYTAIYIPHVYAKDETSFKSGINVLEQMTISEQNFFDEDDKPMTLREVLEEISKFLNWTCVDWKGELYFIDIDHSGKFYKYDPVSFEKVGDATVELLDIQSIGFRGANHALDILPGYNKVTVKNSNYCISSDIKEEDYDNLKVFYVDEGIYSSPAMGSRREFLIPQKNELIPLQLLDDGSFKEVDINTYIGKNPLDLFGAVAMRYCNYEVYYKDGQKYPKITDYTYTNVIQCRERRESDENCMYTTRTPIMRIKLESMVYSDGAFAINGSRKSLFGSNLNTLNGDRDDAAPVPIEVQLRIGNNYYNGSDWVTTPSVISLGLDLSSGTREFIPIRNTKTLDMPYKGLKGYVIPIDKKVISGDLELTLYAPMANNEYFVPYGYFFKDFALTYQKKEGTGVDNNNSDRLYENVINEKYINELDEIELKISSYNSDGACYSKVILGDIYLTDNLYSSIEETAIRPEEQLIRRIIKRYSSPSIKLTQIIKNIDELTPISRLYDNYMVNKRFINAGGTIDYKMNQFQCIMIEV